MIVVDNASSDGSCEMIRREFPEVRLFSNQSNVGFAKGNNQGLQEARGRFILLLNPDTKLFPSSLRIMVEFLDSHPDVGAVGPLLQNPDGSLQPSCNPAPTLFREIWRLFHLDKLYPLASYRQSAWDRHTPRQVDVLQGAYLMVRRAALDDVGELDAAYFMYSEEVDLCYRLRKAGWGLVWVPEAKVVHYGGQSTRQVKSRMFEHLYQSKIIYFRINHGHLAAGIYKVILFGAGLFRLILMPFAILFQPANRQNYEDLAKKYKRLLATIPRM
jgi:hypothetical protein